MGDLGDRRIIMTMSENGNGNDVCSNKMKPKKENEQQKNELIYNRSLERGGEGVE